MHPGGFHLFLKGQENGDLPDLGRLPAEELRLNMSSSSCFGLGPRVLGEVLGVSAGPGAHLDGGLIEFSTAASPCIWRLQRGFQLSDEDRFFFAEAQAVDCGAFLQKNTLA